MKKHINVQNLNNTELKATTAGTIITCGLDGDLCKKLSVVTATLEQPNESHKVILG